MLASGLGEDGMDQVGGMNSSRRHRKSSAQVSQFLNSKSLLLSGNGAIDAVLGLSSISTPRHTSATSSCGSEQPLSSPVGNITAPRLDGSGLNGTQQLAARPSSIHREGTVAHHSGSKTRRSRSYSGEREGSSGPNSSSGITLVTIIIIIRAQE